VRSSSSLQGSGRWERRLCGTRHVCTDGGRCNVVWCGPVSTVGGRRNGEGRAGLLGAAPRRDVTAAACCLFLLWRTLR